MEILTALALLGIPTALGVIWLRRSVFKDVSLSNTPAADPKVARAEQHASGLNFQLAIAEDLNQDATTLNAVQSQLNLAEAEAERVRQEAQQEERSPALSPSWGLAQVPAFHSEKKTDNN